MRRKLYSLTAGLAAALLLGAACSSDDTAEKPVPEPATLTAPALTLSADAVLIDPELSDQPALHAEWTAATDDEQTEVAYTLYVNLTDRDMFSGPVVIDKGAALTHDFTHGELNQLLLNTFDLEAGTEAACWSLRASCCRGCGRSLPHPDPAKCSAPEDLRHGPEAVRRPKWRRG